MSRNVTVSLVSFPTLGPDEPDRLARTLERMSTYVEHAAHVGSDLVAFPEICNTLGASQPWQFEPLDGVTVSRLCAAARAHRMYVVCPLGTLEDGVRYNSAVLIGRDGEIAGVYHKNFPTPGELEIGIIPGTVTPVFETDFGRLGLCICFDLNYDEVGQGLCNNRAELVIWSSMWPGARMLTRWCLDYGFAMGAAYAQQSTFVDIAGREIVSLKRHISDQTGCAPLTTATLNLERRLLHHDGNVKALKPLFDKYGPTAAYVEWLDHECLLLFASQTEGLSSDGLIQEFGLEPLRDYYARVRRERQRALAAAPRALTAL